MTLIEMGILYAMATMPVRPYLAVEQERFHLFYRIEASAKCSPVAVTTWNPITAAWDVRAGLRLAPFEVYAGHRSEHGIGAPDSRFGVQSFDFVGVKYTQRF